MQMYESVNITSQSIPLQMMEKQEREETSVLKILF